MWRLCINVRSDICLSFSFYISIFQAHSKHLEKAYTDHRAYKTEINKAMILLNKTKTFIFRLPATASGDKSSLEDNLHDVAVSDNKY